MILIRFYHNIHHLINIDFWVALYYGNNLFDVGSEPSYSAVFLVLFFVGNEEWSI